jgi:hypothetical protein
MNNLMYDIILIVTSVTLYTVILSLGYRQSVKEYRRALSVVTILQEVVQEIKDILNKEEKGMEGFNERGPRKATFEETVRHKAKHAKNLLTLTQLLTNKPTPRHYEELVDLLTKLAKKTYQEYKFLIAKSTDETKDPNFLQIVSNSKDEPELHKIIFVKAIEYGIDMRELQKRFAERVALGKVITLGENAVVITDDGTGNPPTGVSPINNGLEGGEICFIISFIKAENYEEWHKNTFPEEEGNE